MAFLVMLETLSPSERAAYLLLEVFDYEFEEIATLLNKSAVNVRQITARARRRLGQRERRFQPKADRADDLGIDLHRGYSAGTLKTVPVKPWTERGISAAFYDIIGAESLADMYVGEIAPGQSSRPARERKKRDSQTSPSILRWQRSILARTTTW